MKSFQPRAIKAAAPFHIEQFLLENCSETIQRGPRRAIALVDSHNIALLRYMKQISV